VRSENGEAGVKVGYKWTVDGVRESLEAQIASTRKTCGP
jgi:hypothetical protein